MRVTITKDMANAIGIKALKPFDLEEHHFKWQKANTIHLGKYSETQLAQLSELLAPHTSIRGTRAAVRNIKAWLDILAGDSSATAKTVDQFCSLLIAYIKPSPRKHLYKRSDTVSEANVCYYVASIIYHPPREHRDSTSPPYVEMNLVYTYFGIIDDIDVRFYASDCLQHTAAEALANKGFILENDEYRAQYEEEIAAFDVLATSVGLQCLADGAGVDDLDGNPKKNSDGWWSRRTNTIHMAKDGVPARVVIDVYKEEDNERAKSHSHYDMHFWDRALRTADDGDEGVDTEVACDDEPKIDIPVHPFLAVFDLKRHLRLTLHVSYVMPYVYNTALADQLVLPRDVKELVDMLLMHKGGFQDIVSGKSGGSTVLCCGKPGTGKTLTAEVYAESRERPLYSVQASQLGVDPSELEDELLKVFARAQRWNAILLIDEADVYVRARGDDLQQNAIVGVFLRVLEYYSGVLFMTTNRADLVDDAIASRCLARIEYQPPPAEDQKKIWRILADANGVELSDKVIAEVVAQHGDLSGRNIKNLLKLARLVSSSRGEKITAKLVDYVYKFLPTKE